MTYQQSLASYFKADDLREGLNIEQLGNCAVVMKLTIVRLASAR